MPDTEFDGASQGTVRRSGLKITDESPGTRLNLEWQGSRPWGWWRILFPFGVLTGFVLLGIGPRGPFMTAWEQITAPGPRDVGNDVILGFIVCGCVWMLWTSCRVLGQFAGYWSGISFEATEQLLVLRRRGWGLWGNRTTTILFPQLQRLYLRVGQDGRGPFPLRLLIDYRHREKLENLSLDFELLDCNNRADALEFLLSIGRILAAKGYIKGEDTPRNAAWQLALPYFKPDSGTEDPWTVEDIATERADNSDLDDDDNVGAAVDLIPIPVSGDLGRDDSQPVGATATLVDQQLADRVNLETINEKLVFTEVVEWNPGDRVRFVRERAPALVFVFVFVVGAVIGAGIGGWPVYGFLEGFVGHGAIWWPATAGLGALIGAVALSFIAWNQFQEQSVTIDWTDRVIIAHQGLEHIEQPFDAFRSLVLSKTTHTEYSGADSKGRPQKATTRFGCRLDLVLVDRDLPLLATDSWDSNPSAGRDLLQPLATSLAQSLGLTCSYDPNHKTDAAAVRRAFQFTRLQQVVLAALLLIAVGGIVQGARQRRVRIDAGQAVRNLGGEAVFMNGFTMKNKPVYRDYWKVEFKDDAAIDEHLAKLRPALAQIPEWGAEVENCPLTDAGLKQFEGLTGLRIFSAWSTRMTDAGLQSLCSCKELVYLNLAGNQVTDASVPHLLGLTRLRFLFLGGTRLTDEGLGQLGQLKSLEYLQLTGSDVTPDGVRKLQAVRPDLEIDFAATR